MDEFQRTRRIIRETLEEDAAPPRAARREAAARPAPAPQHFHFHVNGPLRLEISPRGLRLEVATFSARPSPQAPEIPLPEEGEG